MSFEGFTSALWEQMQVLGEGLSADLATLGSAALTAIPFLIAYVVLVLLCMTVWRFIRGKFRRKQDFTALKTVTFGDESAVRAERAGSIISIAVIFLLWGAFTGSSLLPSWLHAPGPFTGNGSFSYTVEAPDGSTDDATVEVAVFPVDGEVAAPKPEAGDGVAKNDGVAIAEFRTKLVIWDKNDDVKRKEGARISAINGVPTTFDPSASEQPADAQRDFEVDFGKVTLTDKGTLNITPNTGWQMESIWLPAPEAVWHRLVEIASAGYQNVTLLEHVGYSLFRVIVGFAIGALIGIPLGYAMGLSNWFRGWFDPIVEFMRPVPPLALIPLVIIWAGIGETGKIILLFLAALWIMTIAARAGVSGVNISKVHAAYSLGASKWQLLRHVIIPNSLPDIFTGARVAMGVCWGTVVAAELVAAEKGVGKMIIAASKFQNTDIVIMGIILIGIIGFGIDMLMRWAERLLVPWKGRG